ncbi:unnamed protein product [Meloidogyne enterolobii]|uniref:Uncharacterized protein n=1 Tax=Meloidogyne enterolobii TaxID=390850 RepID=A0ACB0Z331_MELEN
MKLDSIIIILTFNAIFWSLINSVKNNKDKNELNKVRETSKDNDGAESSVDPQIQMLKPKPKIAKKGTTNDKKEEKRLNRSEYMKIYRQKNKEKINENNRKYLENNKEKKKESARIYRQNNKEKIRESKRAHYQNNRENLKEYARKYRENYREKRKESARKYRERMKNKKENLKNVDPKVENIHSNNNEGTSFVNTQNADFRNKGKLPIVYEESIQFEEGNLFNQEEEESNKYEAETYMEEQNQTVVKEPTKINSINQSESDEEDYLRYLNDKPEDED